MHLHLTTAWRTRIAAGAFAAVLSVFALTASVQAADPNTPVDAIRTATPIKHVIIIVGENRSFDHLFAAPPDVILPGRISTRSHPPPMAANSSAAPAVRTRRSMARCRRRT